jgi:MoxR-like ATPase
MEPLIQKYCPRHIQDFLGLEEVKQQLSKFATRPYGSAWLFVGSPGTGKSSMARALARDIDVNLFNFECWPSYKCNIEAIRRIIDDCEYMPIGGYFKVLVIDEIDEVSRPVQIALLSILDPPKFPPRVVFVFTANTKECNDPPEFNRAREQDNTKKDGKTKPRRKQRRADSKGLPEKFFSRCRVLEFSTYGMRGELATFLARIWAQEASPDAPTPNFKQMAKESRNNIRAALLALEQELLLAQSSADVIPAIDANVQQETTPSQTTLSETTPSVFLTPGQVQLYDANKVSQAVKNKIR